MMVSTFMYMEDVLGQKGVEHFCLKNVTRVFLPFLRELRIHLKYNILFTLKFGN